MPIGLEDLKSLSSAITPRTETIIERSKNWEKLFEKYSIEQTDDDAVDWEDFEKLNIGEEDDEDKVVLIDSECLSQAEEDSECPSEAENNGETLTHLQPEEKLSYHFTPELLKELKKVFSEKATELGKLNLPLWNYERQQTTVNENVLNTPEYSITSRQMRSNHEKVSSMLSLHQKATDKINVNGTAQSNTDISSTIASLLAIGAGFSMKIREREYDIEVNGGDSGALRKTCSVPNIAKLKPPAVEMKRLAGTSKSSLKDVQSKLPKEKFTKTVKKPAATVVKADKKKPTNKVKSNARVPRHDWSASRSESSDTTSESSSSAASDSSWKPKKTVVSNKPAEAVAKPKLTLAEAKAPRADKKSEKPAAASDERVLAKAKIFRKIPSKGMESKDEVATSIIISDSDESDDDFYLPKASDKKPANAPAAKPKSQISNDSSSSSCDEDDSFWLPKASTVKKAPKNRAKFDENQSPKKIRKLKV